jgi:hypothetical protein
MIDMSGVVELGHGQPVIEEGQLVVGGIRGGLREKVQSMITKVFFNAQE